MFCATQSTAGRPVAMNPLTKFPNSSYGSTYSTQRLPSHYEQTADKPASYEPQPDEEKNQHRVWYLCMYGPSTASHEEGRKECLCRERGSRVTYEVGNGIEPTLSSSAKGGREGGRRAFPSSSEGRYRPGEGKEGSPPII